MNPYAERVVQNGVKPPVTGGLCWQAYMHFDECRAKGVVETREIVELGVAKGLNENNLRTELSYWRKYHGIPARPKPQVSSRTVVSAQVSEAQAHALSQALVQVQVDRAQAAAVAKASATAVPSKAALIAVAGFLLSVANTQVGDG